ncbi:hypothetical protein [Stenotrophomonas sp. Marseille-Q5258]|uniref:hypothetical protein n=1 Tax=Stenotrophomonas sp. Marseille-Q5258 TaxID=2972779 RepID=UPI0021C5FD8F|nr:hypothetical protein [Stenotrophomonas sp. Marseille-Q5258]
MREAMVEQVNLRLVGGEREMREVRETFAKAALPATRRAGADCCRAHRLGRSAHPCAVR